ncbi:uncharacterized protein LOC108471555 [Gossypium arboreum]|uniref:uncharacterized protein LOC108471555 n=1 Tax=Gossypium arboreum TaxID=29729 RepID=UPI0008194CC2|nr:uncharacterized protein LOC108471555 [Gossypium arboreum]
MRDQIQATSLGTTKLSRGVQQPLSGRGQDRGGNSLNRGQKAQGKVLGILKRDIGSTHSYIACTVSETLGALVKSTTSEVTVLSPLGQSIRVNKLFRDIPLEVQGVIFLEDLMELPFGEFDLILGIDWLVKHRVSLDCATKRMVLRTVEENEVIVVGERQNYFSNVISTLRAEKLVRKRCEAYLAYISVLDYGVSSIKDIRKVKDFPNVFLDELPRLLSNREVKFGIKLLPSIAPVSIAPY